MEHDTIYIDGGFVLPSTDQRMFKNSAQAIFLVAAFCGKVNVNVCLITDHTKTENRHSATCGFFVPENVFNNVSYISWDKLPEDIAACSLPSVSVKKGLKIISGLCHVLRYIIHFMVKHGNGSKLLKGLLGHKQCCLKASSEISSRTNLCEVAAPRVIDEWISSHCDVAQISVSKLPSAILDFEDHMSKPIVIHNMDKWQRIVLERLENVNTSEEPLHKKMRTKKKVVNTKDLPPMEHVFTEGIELMVSDLALLPCVHAYTHLFRNKLQELRNHMPLILLWYHRLQSIQDVTSAVSLCGVNLINVSEFVGNKVTQFENGTYQVLELHNSAELQQSENRAESKNGAHIHSISQYKNGIEDNNTVTKSNKKLLDITLRRDLPGLIEKITSDIHVQFENLSREDIVLNWEKLPSGVHPTKGELSLARASRKCHQIENLVGCVVKVCKEGDVLVDFCSGGGHVGIVLAHLLPLCKIILVENKEESLERAMQRIQELNLKNIMIYQCNLDQFMKKFDIGIALHACGVATDMVLQKCIDQKASFVISPCCYGKIQNTNTLCYPQSEMFKSHNVTYEQLVLLGHGGDQTSWNFDTEKAKQGKQCMGLVDTDRIEYAQSKGYTTSIYTMQPHDCSPKNNLIVGVKN
ncbi:glutathione S-transferase C-terminal domain-containing protein-like [Ciona intestinalis]